jgi:hypothetical protein
MISLLQRSLLITEHRHISLQAKTRQVVQPRVLSVSNSIGPAGRSEKVWEQVYWFYVDIVQAFQSNIFCHQRCVLIPCLYQWLMPRQSSSRPVLLVTVVPSRGESISAMGRHTRVDFPEGRLYSRCNATCYAEDWQIRRWLHFHRQRQNLRHEQYLVEIRKSLHPRLLHGLTGRESFWKRCLQLSRKTSSVS